MNKKTIVTKVATRSGLKKSVVNKVLDAMYNTLLSEMQKGEIINFSGFGKFFTHQRTQRKYVSFQTGETFLSPPKLVPVLKFSKQFIEKF